MIRFHGWAAALLLLAGCASDPRAAMAAGRVAPQKGLEVVPLTIQTRAGARQFKVEVARTGDQQETGMMYRNSAPAGTGMIFPFKPARQVSFWMRNTLIPLDLVFIRDDGSIARIAENAKPLSLSLIDSGEPVVAVLEIAGGAARKHGIQSGDKVSWPG